MQASVAQGDDTPPSNKRKNYASSVQRGTTTISDTNIQASTQSTVYWDHNVQMHQRWPEISVVESGLRYVSASNSVGRSVKNSEWNSNPMPTESDNHANTNAFGTNFRPISWCNQHYTVSPFMIDLDLIDNVELCVAGTAWTHSSTLSIKSRSIMKGLTVHK